MNQQTKEDIRAAGVATLAWIRAHPWPVAVLAAFVAGFAAGKWL